jgi:hypothetical protein
LEMPWFDMSEGKRRYVEIELSFEDFWVWCPTQGGGRVRNGHRLTFDRFNGLYISPA